MMAEGRWDEFNDRRVQLIRDGVDSRIVWRIVCNLMPPMDGSPPESRITEDLEPIVTKYMDNKPELPPKADAISNNNDFLRRSAGQAYDQTPSNNSFVSEIKEAKVKLFNEIGIV